ncbi:hypothetical protein ACIBRY_17065 [Streptomyces anulatus]
MGLTSTAVPAVVAALAADNAFLLHGPWADLFGRQQEPGVVTDHAGNGSGSRHMARIGTRHPDVPGGRATSVGGRIGKVVVSARRPWSG